MALPLAKGESANLLSLDGGGIKGISTLVILKAIMDRVQEIEDGNTKKPVEEARLPVDYFHLAGGTSTGGIIALMVFRLRMTPQKAIEAYMAMGRNIFAPGKKGTGGARFSDVPLLGAIDDVVVQYGPTKDKKLKGQAPLVDNQAKMFMCATLQQRGESILLRSYKTPKDAVPVSEDGQKLVKGLENYDNIENLPIAIATRATSAAPTYFPEVSLLTKEGDNIIFWDGGVLNNNPIDQLWRARLDLVGDNDPAPKVKLVVSLGTSWCAKDPPSMLDGLPWGTQWLKPYIQDYLPILSPAEKSLPFLTNTDAKHLDFKRYIRRIAHRTADPDAQTQYFRFNTETENFIDMSEYNKMDDLSSVTKRWLVDDSKAKANLEAVAQLLAKKRG